MTYTEKLLFAVSTEMPAFTERERREFPDALGRGRWLPLACSNPQEACPWGFVRYIEDRDTGWVAPDPSRLGGLLDFMLPHSDPSPRLPPGLHVYEVSFDTGDVEEGFDDNGEFDGIFDHLCMGTMRRPTTGELEAMGRGDAPWGGVLL